MSFGTTGSAYEEKSQGKETVYRMVETRMLRAYMTLKGVTTKDLADAQGWSMSTAYRKITGKVAFTVPEVQLLRRTQFFLQLICPKRQKCGRRSPIPLLQERILCLTD